MLVILDIGYELGALGRHDPRQLLGDRIRCRFDLIEPGEQATRMELAFHQAGVVEVRRVAMERAGPAQRVGAEPLNPAELFVAGTAFRLSRRPPHSLLARLDPGLMVPLALGDGIRHLPGQVSGRLVREGVAPCFAGLRIAHPLQQAGTHQQCGEVARLDRKGLVDGVECRAQIVRAAMHRSDPKPQRGVVRPKASGFLEHPDRLLEVASADRRLRPTDQSFDVHVRARSRTSRPRDEGPGAPARDACGNSASGQQSGCRSARPPGRSWRS